MARSKTIESRMGMRDAKFASVSFTAKDFTEIFDATDREAKLFLIAQEEHLRDLMYNTGEKELIVLARRSGFKER